MWDQLTRAWIILAVGLLLGSSNFQDGSQENPGCPTCIEAVPINTKNKRETPPLSIMLTFNGHPIGKNVEVISAKARQDNAVRKLVQPLIENGDIQNVSFEEEDKIQQNKRDELIELLRLVLKKHKNDEDLSGKIPHAPMSPHHCPFVAKSPEIVEEAPEAVAAKPILIEAKSALVGKCNESQHILDEIYKLLHPLPHDIKAKVLQGIEKIVGFKLDLKQQFDEKVDEVKDHIHDKIHEIKDAMHEKIKEVRDKVDYVKSKVHDVIDNIVDPVKYLETNSSDADPPCQEHVPKNLVSIVKKIVDDLLNKKNQNSSDPSDHVSASHFIPTSLSDIIDKLKSLPDKLHEKLVKAIREIFETIDNLDNTSDTIKNVIRNMLRDLLFPDTGITTRIDNLLGPILDQIADILQNTLKRIVEEVSHRNHDHENLIDFVKHMLNETLHGITGLLTSEPSTTSALEVIPFPEHDVVRPTITNWRKLFRIYPNLPNEIGEEIGNGLKTVLENLHRHPSNKFINSVEKVVEAILTKVLSKSDPLTEEQRVALKPIQEELHNEIVQAVSKIPVRDVANDTIDDTVTSIVPELLKSVTHTFHHGGKSKAAPEKVMPVIIQAINKLLSNNEFKLCGKTFTSSKSLLTNLLGKLNPLPDGAIDKLLKAFKWILEKIIKYDDGDPKKIIKEAVFELLIDLVLPSCAKHDETILKLLDPVAETIGAKVVLGFEKILKELTKDHKGSLTDILQGVVKDSLKDILNSFLNFDSTGESAARTIDEGLELPENLVESVVNIFEGLVSNESGQKSKSLRKRNILDILEKLSKGHKISENYSVLEGDCNCSSEDNDFKSASNEFTSRFNKWLDKIKPGMDKLTEKLNPLEKISEIGDKILGALKWILEKLIIHESDNPKDVVKQAIGNLLQDILGDSNGPDNDVEGIVKLLEPAVETVVEKVIGGIKKVLEELTKKSSGSYKEVLKHAVKDVAKDIGDTLSGLLTSKKYQATEFPDSLLNGIVRTLENLIGKKSEKKHLLLDLLHKLAPAEHSDFGSSLHDKILPKVVTKLVHKGEKLLDQFESSSDCSKAPHGIKVKVIRSVKWILNKLKTCKKENVKDVVKEAIGNIIKDIFTHDDDSGPSPVSEKVEELLDPIVQTLVEKIIKSVGNVIKDIKENNYENLKDILDNLLKDLCKDVLGFLTESSIVVESDSENQHGEQQSDFEEEQSGSEEEKANSEENSKDEKSSIFSFKLPTNLLHSVSEVFKGWFSNKQSLTETVQTDLKENILNILEKLDPSSPVFDKTTLKALSTTLKTIASLDHSIVDIVVKNVIKEAAEHFLGSGFSSSVLETILGDIGQRVLKALKGLLKEIKDNSIENIEERLQNIIEDIIKGLNDFGTVPKPVQADDPIPAGLVPDEVLPVINKIVEELSNKGLKYDETLIKETTDELLEDLLKHIAENASKRIPKDERSEEQEESDEEEQPRKSAHKTDSKHVKQSSKSGHHEHEEEDEEEEEKDDNISRSSAEEDDEETEKHRDHSVSNPTANDLAKKKDEIYRLTLNLDDVVNSEIKKFRRLHCECREKSCPLRRINETKIRDEIEKNILRKLLKPKSVKRSSNVPNPGEADVLEAVKRIARHSTTSTQTPEALENSQLSVELEETIFNGIKSIAENIIKRKVPEKERAAAIKRMVSKMTPMSQEAKLKSQRIIKQVILKHRGDPDNEGELVVRELLHKMLDELENPELPKLPSNTTDSDSSSSIESSEEISGIDNSTDSSQEASFEYPDLFNQTDSSNSNSSDDELFPRMRRQNKDNPAILPTVYLSIVDSDDPDCPTCSRVISKRSASFYDHQNITPKISCERKRKKWIPSNLKKKFPTEGKGASKMSGQRICKEHLVDVAVENTGTDLTEALKMIGTNRVGTMDEDIRWKRYIYI